MQIRDCKNNEIYLFTKFQTAKIVEYESRLCWLNLLFAADCSPIYMKGRRQRGQCRLSWLTNSVRVYEPKCGGKGGEIAGSQPMSTAVRMEAK